MLQYMIPLSFKSWETTFKFTPIYSISLDLCKTGFIKERLSDVNNNTQRKQQYQNTYQEF